MANKSNVLPIVTDHYATLVHGRTEKPRILDYALQLGLPVAAGVAVWLMDVRLRELGGALGGLAVFTALLFGLLVFVFQLRMQAASDPRLGRGHRVLVLIDELFSNVGYSVLVGLVVTGAAMVATTTADGAAGSAPWVSGVLTMLTLHLVVVVLMCLKRARSAYNSMAH